MKNNEKSREKLGFSRFWTTPAFPPINVHVFSYVHFFIWTSVFSCFSVSCSCGFLFFSFSSRFPFFFFVFHCSFHFFFQLDFDFRFFTYILMVSNMLVDFVFVCFHFLRSCCQTSAFLIWFLDFCFLLIVSIVLVSRYVVWCLFPVCVYSCIQIVSFTKSTASFSKTFWLRSTASIANE